MAAYYDALNALGPVVWWKLNDTSGTTVVNSGSAGATGDGTYTETDAEGYTLDQASIIPGEPDEKCVAFNSDDDSGSGGRAWRDDFSGLDYSPNANQMTCIFTYVPTHIHASVTRHVVGKQNEWQLWQLSTGSGSKLQFYFTPAWSSITTDVALSEDTAYHIMLRCDGTNAAIYVGSTGKTLAKSTNLANTGAGNYLMASGGAAPPTYITGKLQSFWYLPGGYVTDSEWTDLDGKWAGAGSGPGRGLRKDPRSGLYLPPTPYFTRRWRR